MGSFLVPALYVIYLAHWELKVWNSVQSLQKEFVLIERDVNHILICFELKEGFSMIKNMREKAAPELFSHEEPVESVLQFL